MPRLPPLLLGLFSILVMAACAPGRSPVSPDMQNQLAKAQALVAGASGDRVKAVSVFEGPDGLVGIITQPREGGSKQLVWGSPNLEVVLPADAIDKMGQSRNAKALLQQKVFISTPELAAQVLGRGIEVGLKGPVVTVFVDPNCSHCNHFYKEVMPLVKQGKVRVRFMLVGFLTPTSEAIAASIVSAKDPARALAEHEKSAGDNSSASTSNVKPDAGAARLVQAQTALMYRAGATGTPAILGCVQGQPEPALSTGMPQDIPAFIATLDAGNPACK